MSPAFVGWILTPLLVFIFFIVYAIILLYQSYKFNKMCNSFEKGRKKVNLTDKQMLTIIDSPSSAYSKMKIVDRTSIPVDKN